MNEEPLVCHLCGERVDPEDNEVITDSRQGCHDICCHCYYAIGIHVAERLLADARMIWRRIKEDRKDKDGSE